MRAQEPTPGHTHTVKRKLKGASRGNAVARSTPGSTPLAFVTPCPLGMHFSPHLRRKMRCCAAAIQGSFNTTRAHARRPGPQAASIGELTREMRGIGSPDGGDGASMAKFAGLQTSSTPKA